MIDSGNSNNGGFDILRPIHQSPLTASVISKVIRQPTNIASSGIQSTQQAAEVSQGEAFAASLDIQRKVQNIENALELNPDIELSKQTVISSIMAPTTMMEEDFSYKVLHECLTPEVKNKFEEVLKNTIENHYGLRSRAYKIFENALFDKGAQIEMVLPESAIDEVVNSGSTFRVESAADLIKKVKQTKVKLGYLGTYTEEQTLRVESSHKGVEFVERPLGDDGAPLSQFITISEDFENLKLSSLLKESGKMFSKARIRSAARSFRKESRDKSKNESQNFRTETFSPKNQITDAELKDSLFKSAPQGSDMFLRIPEKVNLKRRSIGRPLEITPPVESCILIHYPGEPSRHIGAFFLIDQNGHFLSIESQRKYMSYASSQVNKIVANTTSGNTSNISGSLLEKARNNLKGVDTTEQLMYLSDIFGSLVEEDIIKRIRSGIHSTEAALSKNNDIYGVMLARAFAGLQTQMVFVPAEFFTYYAFQYNRNGTGRSYISDMEGLISLRSISLYSKIATQIRNAISVTDINLELDPKDATPKRTIEKVMDLATQTRQQFFPWGLNSPGDIADWFHRAGFQMHVTGHPKIPATKIEYAVRNHDRNVPNIDDDDQLNDMIHMHFGVTPEMRDAGLGAQFATGLANSNILFGKRIMRLQGIANSLLSDHSRKIVSNDQIVYRSLYKIIKDNWGNLQNNFTEELKNFVEQNPEDAMDFFLEEVIETISIELPKPNTTSLSNQLEAFKVFKEALDDVFEVIISDDAVSQELFGESASKISSLKEPLKAQLIRDWMRNNNFMTELFDLVEVGEEGKSESVVVQSVMEHLKRLAINVTELHRSFTKVRVATLKDIQELSGEPQDEGVPAEDGETTMF